MERSTKAFIFLIFATPLWALVAFGIEKLESMYGKISPEILIFVYPTLIVALVSTLFLWKLRISLLEFAVMASIVPLIVVIALSVVTMIEDLRSSSYHSDDSGFFIFFLFYLFPVVSFLLGAIMYYTITRLKGDA
ncbi:hypothetical protein [Thermococcus sp. 2319x1]|uniref:hypothetical protein n=1 Tax=Thermococcus sp. 2319x1 TaxID=1674923 RepID=UPI00158349D2|nr:hypothetical protein [Thermococcus sp. 2319x1]